MVCGANLGPVEGRPHFVFLLAWLENSIMEPRVAFEKDFFLQQVHSFFRPRNHRCEHAPETNFLAMLLKVSDAADIVILSMG